MADQSSAHGPLHRPWCVVVLALCLVLTACAGHAARTEGARDALDAMQPRGALALLNKELKVDRAEELPEKISGKNTLLVLDRAMVLQALDRYELASRDLETADKSIEILDFSRNALDEVGKFMFSDASGPYKAPAYEKLFINTMNMVNYLARGDLSGARVEARRLAVMQKYLKDHEDPARALTGPGSYFAGFVFEKSGNPDEALRYYDEALAYGTYQSLAEPVRRLSELSGFRSPRLEKLLGGASPAPQAADSTSAPAGDPGSRAPGSAGPDAAGDSGSGAAPAPAAAPADDSAELLVVVSFGRVPAKEAKRVPIGLALTYASGAISPMNYQRANRLAAQGLVTWVNYPELGAPRGTYSRPYFRLEGRPERLEGLMAVDREVKAAWDKVKGVVVAAAITRMVTRIVAGEAVRRSTGKSDEGQILGFLLSLGTQAAMTAADTPDTRSWSTLPARIAVGRVRLPPGTYTVTVGASGFEKRQRVTLEPRGWAVVNLTALN